MSACEKCWADAWWRACVMPSKLQAEHDRELLHEREQHPCSLDEQRGTVPGENTGDVSAVPED